MVLNCSVWRTATRLLIWQVCGSSAIAFLQLEAGPSHPRSCRCYGICSGRMGSVLHPICVLDRLAIPFSPPLRSHPAGSHRILPDTTPSHHIPYCRIPSHSIPSHPAGSHPLQVVADIFDSIVLVGVPTSDAAAIGAARRAAHALEVHVTHSGERFGIRTMRSQPWDPNHGIRVSVLVGSGIQMSACGIPLMGCNRPGMRSKWSLRH
jgi:hypothetical protein